jgi:diamine N-acetyltransferase
MYVHVNLYDAFAMPNPFLRVCSRACSSRNQIAVDNRCRRLELSCLAWNKPTIDWYARRGIVDVTEQEQWHLFRLDSDGLQRLAAANCGQ